MGENFEAVDGVTVATQDGAVYFIPEVDLELFRLPNEEAAKVHATIEGEDEVSGHNYDPIWSQNLSRPLALYGKLLERPVGQPSLLVEGDLAARPTKKG